MTLDDTRQVQRPPLGSGDRVMGDDEQETMEVMMWGNARPSKPVNEEARSANITSGGGASPGDVITLDDEGIADPEILAVTDIICLDCDDGKSGETPPPLQLGLAHAATDSSSPAVGISENGKSPANGDGNGNSEHEASASSLPTPSEPNRAHCKQQHPSKDIDEHDDNADDGSAAPGRAACQSTHPGGEATVASAKGCDGIARRRAPKYPVGCPVLYNIQRSKPCSKFLLSKRGVVKSASLDRRSGEFVYKVENEQERDVAEKELVFAVHCPVYVKTDNGGKPEVEGEVLLAKPASGNHNILYTVMLSTGDAVKIEEGVAPDRVRYRVQLQTLQSRLRDTRAASKRQKGFGIRTSKEGKPVWNASRPVVRMKAAKRKRASITHAEEDSDGSADSSDSDDAKSEETVSLKPTKKRRSSSSGYTGAYWKKRKNRFESRICFNSKQHQIGSYKYSADAALAYDEASKSLRKAKTKFNFGSKRAYEDAIRAEMRIKGRCANVAASWTEVLAKVKARVAKISGESTNKSKDEAADERTDASSPGNNNDISTPPSSADSDAESEAEPDDESEADSEDESYVDDSECSAEEELPQPASKKQKSAGDSFSQSLKAARYTGVYWNKPNNKFASQIYFVTAEAKMHRLGYYDSGADAALAYDECAKLLRKECKPNFLDRQAYESAVRKEMEIGGQCTDRVDLDLAASAAAVLAKVKAKVANITEQTGPNNQSDALD